MSEYRSLAEKFANKEVVILDGAVGTQLQSLHVPMNSHAWVLKQDLRLLTAASKIVWIQPLREKSYGEVHHGYSNKMQMLCLGEKRGIPLDHQPACQFLGRGRS